MTTPNPNIPPAPPHADSPPAIPPAAPATPHLQPPAQSTADQIPVATMLSYENKITLRDPITRRWLITAGVLWILTGIGPMILGGVLVFEITRQFQYGRGTFRYEDFIFFISISMLLAGTALSYTLGIASFLQRQWIVHLAPAWALLLLTIHATFDLFMLFAMAMEGFRYITAEIALIILAIAFLPLAVFILLSYIHLRKPTIPYLCSVDTRSSRLAGKSIRNCYLAVVALVVGTISAIGAFAYMVDEYLYASYSDWAILLTILASVSMVVAVLSWIQSKANRIVGTVLYMAWLAAFIYDGYAFFGREMIPLLIFIALAILFGLLHAFNRSRPRNASPWGINDSQPS